jgi:hypothetical protein
MKTGSPPTLLNALTGEFTPPGIDFWALANNFELVSDFIAEDLPVGVNVFSFAFM